MFGSYKDTPVHSRQASSNNNNNTNTNNNNIALRPCETSQTSEQSLFFFKGISSNMSFAIALRRSGKI